VRDNLSPRPLRWEEADIAGDIDSMVAVCVTIEPFQCERFAEFAVHPTYIQRCKNAKLTAYFNARPQFQHTEPEPDSFRAVVEQIDREAAWYEFEAGRIDNCPLYVLFQVDVPVSPDEDEEGIAAEQRQRLTGPLREACQAITGSVIFPAMTRLRAESTTARGGGAYLRYEANRTYRVFAEDFEEFAVNVTQLLAAKDLRERGRVNFVRFYAAEHGLRACDKAAAGRYLRDSVDLSHPHAEIAQIHHSYSVILRGRDSPILVDLSERLTALFATALRVGTRRKVERYRAGFLADYGHFAVNGSPLYADREVTFAQGYNSAAKMSRPRDAGNVPAAMLLHGFRRMPAYRKQRDEIRQQTHDLLAFVENYVVRNHELRIEEVVTLDKRRHGDLRDKIERLGIFGSRNITATTAALLDAGMLFVLHRWDEHAVRHIQSDYDLVFGLRRARVSRALYASHETVLRFMRAEFRLLYFAHGANHGYSYAVQRAVFAEGTERASINHENVHLRPHAQPDDEWSPHPRLYARLLPLPLMHAINHIIKILVSNLLV